MDPANSTSQPATLQSTSKRVILRISPRSDLEYEEDKFNEYIQAFAAHYNRSKPRACWWSDYFMHLQLCSTTHPWHIILDLNVDNFDGSDFNQIPHEIYKVQRLQTGLSVATTLSRSP
jgi:hypothetical protein